MEIVEQFYAGINSGSGKVNLAGFEIDSEGAKSIWRRQN